MDQTTFANAVADKHIIVTRAQVEEQTTSAQMAARVPYEWSYAPAIDVTNDSPALLTKIAVGLDPYSIGIRPGAPTVPGDDVPVNPTPQVSIVFSQ